MTLNPRASGLRASRRRAAGDLARRGPVAAVVTAMLLLLTLVIAPAPAGAATDDPLVFTVAPRGDGVVEPGQSLFVTLAADNTTSSAVHGGDVVVSMGRAPLTDRAELAAWLGDERPTLPLRELATATIDVIPPYGQRAVDLVVDADDLGGDELAPGVYPLLATYTSGTRVETSAAVFTVPDDADEGTGTVAVVVPITAPATGAGLLTADELAVLTGPGGALREQLDAVTATDAILAVDPAIAAAIRVLGAAAPETAAAWLEDLLALPNDRFALQFGDADLAAQVNAGLSRPLTVPTLASYLDPEDFSGVIEPTPTPTPTPGPGTTVPDAPMLPDTDALLAIGPTVGTVLWPATGTAGADVVHALGAAVSDDVPTVLVPSSAVSRATGPRAASDDAQLLVYDADVSAALHEASATAGEIDRDAALASATAFAHFAPGALLVTLDRAPARTADALDDALSAAWNLPGREPATFAEIADRPATSVDVADVEPEAARVAALDSFRDGEAELSAFASILEDPTLITGPERASILQLMGNAWRSAPGAWTAAIAEHAAATETTLDAVGIVPPSDKTLLGSTTPMQFAVRNDLPWPVSLVLLAHPNDPRLVVQSTTPVDAGPQQNTRVEVPVEARVGRGESSIDLRLRSPTMVAIGDEVRVGVSVNAEWERVGVIVMAVLVGGMLALGIFRTVSRVRSRRRSRVDAGVAAEQPTDAGAREGDDV